VALIWVSHRPQGGPYRARVESARA